MIKARGSDTCNISVQPTDMVSDVVAKLEASRLPHQAKGHRVRLIYKSKVLAFHVPLSAYSVKDGSTVLVAPANIDHFE